MTFQAETTAASSHEHPAGHNYRLRHILFLFGGFWGALIGFIVSITYHALVGWGLVLSVLVGLLANVIFNFWFSFTVLWLRQIPVNRNGASYASFILINAVLICLGLGALIVATELFRFSSPVACAMVFIVTSLLSLVAGRIWVFVSPSRAYEAYEQLEDSFYTDSGDAAAVGRFRAWYHRGRWNETLRHFRALYQPGKIAYDLGSGGSEWNTDGLPLIGVDVNENLLKQGQSLRRISSYIVAQLTETEIPAKSADIVVLTEVLEHMEKPEAVLAEIRRILNPSGHLLLSVPNDWVLSPFFWLFNLQCFFRGYILSEDYYRERCGHVNHFTPALLSKTLRKAGFSVKSINVFRGLLIFTVSQPTATV